MCGQQGAPIAKKSWSAFHVSVGSCTNFPNCPLVILKNPILSLCIQRNFTQRKWAPQIKDCSSSPKSLFPMKIDKSRRWMKQMMKKIWRWRGRNKNLRTLAAWQGKRLNKKRKMKRKDHDERKLKKENVILWHWKGK